MGVKNSKRILSFIESIRDSFPDSVYVYTKGGCYKFFLILKNVFPKAVAYYDSHHVITEIGGKFYDITGEVCIGKHTSLEDDPGMHDRVIAECKFYSLVDQVKMLEEYSMDLEAEREEYKKIINNAIERISLSKNRAAIKIEVRLICKAKKNVRRHS